MNKRLEMAANVATVVLCCLVGLYLFLYHFGEKRQVKQQIAHTERDLIGRPIHLAGLETTGKPKTLLMGLSTKCHFCAESAPFYKSLVTESNLKGIPVVAVFPQSSVESRVFLDALRIPAPTLKQSTLAAIGVVGTPTLMILDEQGLVRDAWIGKLPPSRQDEVFAKLGLSKEKVVAQR